MMILNINGKKILDDISQLNSHPNDTAFLLNKDGYYLYSDDPNKNFAFMFPERKKRWLFYRF